MGLFGWCLTCVAVDCSEVHRPDEQTHRPTGLLPLPRQERGALGVGSQGSAPCWEGCWVGLVLQTTLDGLHRLLEDLPPQHLATDGRQGHHTVL